MEELELKYLLSHHQYRCLRDFVENYFKYQLQNIKNVNYYYDTQDRFYLDQNTTIRIRETNGSLIGNVKIHSLNKPHSSEELPFEVERVPQCLTYQGKTLKCMGALTTYRYFVPITNGVSLCLDKNHYLGEEDYELEIEFHEDHFIEAWKTAVLLTTVLGHCYDPDQCFQKSTSKSNRFFKRLGKLSEAHHAINH